MNFINDAITYIRRIIKSPSNAVISDDLIIDYINRFYISDVDARLQLFDLKKTYQFQTIPGVDKYNMPLYSIQTEGLSGTNIGMYPVYQGFLSPAYINGIQVPLHTQEYGFFNIWPKVTQQLNVVATGDGTAGPYTINIPILPNSTSPQNPPIQALLRGHVDISGIIATGLNIDPPFSNTINPVIPNTSIESAVWFTSIDAYGNNVIVQDSGQFLFDGHNEAYYGLLMQPGPAPYGNLPLSGGYSTTLNTINYLTGVANVTFPVDIPVGQNINAQCFYFQSGLPRAILYYNNTLTLRSPPDTQYLVELSAYLSPAAFMASTDALQFAYMAEYIARGAARKILSDTGDVEQFMFYEPLFREQELLVWKRSQRQWTNNRTETIYSQGFGQGQNGNSNMGGTI
jgi:hypothetical protein